MVQPFPAPSLRELARPTGVTEGVSSDGSTGPTIYTPAHINSETFELLRSSKDTPSVSLSLDSSLREGAGRGLLPFIGVLAKPWGCGRFSSPLRRAGSIHRSTLPQSRIRSTAPSGREPGNGVPFNRVLANVRGCGRFSSPLRNSEELTFIIEGTYL